MPLPRIDTPFTPCVGFYRDGFWCKNKKCNKCHTRIDKKAWKECVEKNSCMVFNPKRVKSIANDMSTMTPKGGQATLVEAVKGSGKGA